MQKFSKPRSSQQGGIDIEISLNSNGKAYVAGYTHSTNFPTRNPYQAGRAGNRDAFVAKFDPAAGGDASLLYSTYLGGGDNDRGLALALGRPDQVFVTGLTQSSHFPVASAYDSSFAGGTCGTRSCYDAFVFHLDLAANSLVYSTYPSTSSGQAWGERAMKKAGPSPPAALGMLTSPATPSPPTSRCWRPSRRPRGQTPAPRRPARTPS